MKKINERLAEERKRLGLNKGQMAAAGEVANSTYGNYEDGEREPTSAFYSAIHKAGADINYIITGEHVPPIEYPTGGLQVQRQLQQSMLSRREEALLDDFRSLSDVEKDAAETMLHAVAKHKVKKA